MAVIKKFKVLKVAYFLGIFGIFSGLILGIIGAILTLYIPVLFDYEIWQVILACTFGNGILMFILALIFVPLVNLSLKIIKGLHLETDSSSFPVKGLVSTSKKPSTLEKLKSSASTTKLATKPTEKPIAMHPVVSAKDSRPLSQMTNVKTTAPKQTTTPPSSGAVSDTNTKPV